LKKELWS